MKLVQGMLAPFCWEWMHLGQHLFTLFHCLVKSGVLGAKGVQYILFEFSWVEINVPSWNPSKSFQGKGAQFVELEHTCKPEFAKQAGETHN